MNAFWNLSNIKNKINLLIPFPGEIPDCSAMLLRTSSPLKCRKDPRQCCGCSQVQGENVIQFFVCLQKVEGKKPLSTEKGKVQWVLKSLLPGCRRLIATSCLGWDLFWKRAGESRGVSARARAVLPTSHLGAWGIAVCCSEQLLWKILGKLVVKRTETCFWLPEKLVCLSFFPLLKCFLLSSRIAKVHPEMPYSLFACAFQPSGAEVLQTPLRLLMIWQGWEDASCPWLLSWRDSWSDLDTCSLRSHFSLQRKLWPKHHCRCLVSKISSWEALASRKVVSSLCLAIFLHPPKELLNIQHHLILNSSFKVFGASQCYQRSYW